MRAILLILIVIVVAVIGILATGLVDVTQRRGATAPDVAATGNGVTARGGQAPAFDIETGSVAVGTRPANVTLPMPEVRVKPAANGQQPAQPSPQQNTQQAQQQPAQQQPSSIQGNGI